MRLVLGLDSPTAGTVTVRGTRYADLPSPAHVVGALLDARAVHPGRTAANHLLALTAQHLLVIGRGLLIADTLSPEAAARVFDRFYRADPSRTRDQGGGAGLGLAIAWSLVTAHGGRVELVTRLGEGATFRVTLPSA